MIQRSRLQPCALLLLLTIGLGEDSVAAAKRTAAVQAREEIPEELLLDVGIEVFDPGLSQDQRADEGKGVFSELRKAEARYMAYLLKNTLESTGQWGAVRVLPRGVGTTDVRVSARIRRSTGYKLELRAQIVDATGRQWKSRKYREEAYGRAYDDRAVSAGDPYQHLYNRIANDMLAARDNLSENDIVKIRTVTRLQFAADLAPAVYGDYLKTNRKGKVKISRLPSDDDPMMQRVALIRERDYMFVDLLNEHYAGFYTRMGTSYDEWRKFSYDEERSLLTQRKESNKLKWIGAILIAGGLLLGDDDTRAERAAKEAAIYGGVMTIASGIEKGKESQIHIEALKELAASFDAEVSPMLVEVEGQTLRLEGSAETQYAEWRSMLNEIFTAETGLSVDPDDSDAVVEPSAAQEG